MLPRLEISTSQVRGSHPDRRNAGRCRIKPARAERPHLSRGEAKQWKAAARTLRRRASQGQCSEILWQLLKGPMCRIHNTDPAAPNGLVGLHNFRTSSRTVDNKSGVPNLFLTLRGYIELDGPTGIMY